MATWLSIASGLIVLAVAVIKYMSVRQGKQDAKNEIVRKEAEKRAEVLKAQRDVKPIRSHDDVRKWVQKRKDNSK